MAKKSNKTKRNKETLIDLGGKKKGLAEIFREIDKKIKSVTRHQGRKRTDITLVGEIKGLGSRTVKAVYGFSMKPGEPGGQPWINVLPRSDKIKITAEIPGVKKDKIGIKLKDDVLEIGAEDSGRKYHKKISLPFPVNKRPVRLSYRNGVLRITLAKRNR